MESQLERLQNSESETKEILKAKIFFKKAKAKTIVAQNSLHIVALY